MIDKPVMLAQREKFVYFLLLFPSDKIFGKVKFIIVSVIFFELLQTNNMVPIKVFFQQVKAVQDMLT